jgi:hypothetical protein
MKVEERIKAFSALGAFLGNLLPSEFQSMAEGAARENPWFTKENVRMATDGIRQFLKEETLVAWTSPYKLPETPRKIALVMAGNIPLVGFHDLLSVLISGHSAVVKLSSKDNFLPRFFVEKLIDAEPRFGAYITFADRLQEFDAVIATGSDNSSRYFDYYFGKYPHIIRKNRTSIAILDGTESEEELKALGIDIFSYFGLGCRNVSKLFVPENYSPGTFFRPLEMYHDIIHQHKYCNNYDYQKSILLVNGIPFLDNGFMLLQENQKLVSPISTVYYEHYRDAKDLREKIELSKDKIQCIVGKTELATIPFGQAQYPAINDYADKIDTLKFLTSLN